MVILPDVRGLHAYYEQLAVRFAEAGFHAVAIDYFGRTQGVAERADGFDWQSEIGTLTDEGVASDVAAAVAHLGTVHAGPTFTLGFCFGGSHSWRLSAGDLGLSGVMGFYGRPAMIADVEDSMRTPLLLLVAGADAATPVEEFEALDARLSAADVPPRDARLRRGAALVLRPRLRRVARRLRRRVDPHPRLHRGELRRRVITTTWRPSSSRIDGGRIRRRT